MTQSSNVVLLVFALACVNYAAGWVFTEIDYEQLARVSGEDLEQVLNDEELRELKFSLIYPGTKWCGAGNIADSYDDLGSSAETDMCCRAHDNCPDVALAGETKNNLTNTAFYSRLSCQCDEEFHQCLHDANTSTAKQIGTIYFNALGTMCFREDYPATSCKRRGGWFNRKCLEHEYDITGQKVYQWFDVPNY